MAAKVKGIFKGFKNIPGFFVYKEPEMEIGYPTNVKHVAHIGWDGSSENAPTWMNEFNTSSNFSSSSLVNFAQSTEASWVPQDYGQPERVTRTCGGLANHPHPKIPKAPKKSKRKKNVISTDSSSISSRASFTTAVEDFDDLSNECEAI